MTDCQIALIAVSILNAFLTANGFVPSGGWDINDPNCFMQYGPHIVISLSGCALPGASVDKAQLWNKFVVYMQQINSMPGTFQKFAPYDIDIYIHPENTYLYLALAQ